MPARSAHKGVDGRTVGEGKGSLGLCLAYSPKIMLTGLDPRWLRIYTYGTEAHAMLCPRPTSKLWYAHALTLLSTGPGGGLQRLQAARWQEPAT